MALEPVSLVDIKKSKIEYKITKRRKKTYDPKDGLPSFGSFFSWALWPVCGFAELARPHCQNISKTGGKIP